MTKQKKPAKTISKKAQRQVVAAYQPERKPMTREERDRAYADIQALY